MIICSQRNEGPGAARNKGMEHASGEYLYFLDSDDCLVNMAMDIWYKYAKENQLDIVMFDADVFGDVECVKTTYDRAQMIEEQKSVMSGEEYARNTG